MVSLDRQHRSDILNKQLLSFHSHIDFAQAFQLSGTKTMILIQVIQLYHDTLCKCLPKAIHEQFSDAPSQDLHHLLGIK